MANVKINFSSLLYAGVEKQVEAIPEIREAARQRYIADPTLYRKEKYSCRCRQDFRKEIFITNPLCFVHSNPVDLDPQYRDVDPPTSWINTTYGPDVMINCFKEAVWQRRT